MDAAALGQGSLILLSGEAGVGKTRLAAEAAAGAKGPVLWGGATRGTTPPHGPVVAALRSYLRAVPDGLAHCGPLRQHLALLLPELGPPPEQSDRETLFEAVRCAFVTVASDGPAVVVLDDLQWSDEATLEQLAALAGSLGELQLLVPGACRSGRAPRSPPLRRLRHRLRRRGRLDGVAAGPAGRPRPAALAGRILGEPPSSSLARAIHDRTQGIAFFVEELTAALLAGGAVRPGSRGMELAGEGTVPLPDTVRDAVLMRASGLSPEARAAAEAAAVA